VPPGARIGVRSDAELQRLEPASASLAHLLQTGLDLVDARRLVPL
jgi:hypothetical protein